MKTLLAIICPFALLFMMKYKMDAVHYSFLAESWEKIAKDNTTELVNNVTDLEKANYLLTQKVQYAVAQEEYMIDRCGALIKRLKLTTDALQSTIECRDSRDTLETCTGFSLISIIKDNRKANF